MSIGGYVSKMQELLWELKTSLSSDAVDKLKQELDGPSGDKWFSFCYENLELISEFQSAPPSKRARLVKFQDPGLNRKFVLAAYQNLMGGYQLLENFAEYQYEGLSYRDAGALAGRNAYNLFLKHPYRLWPFDDIPPNGFRVDKGFGY